MRGALSIPLAIAISLVGSAVVATAGYFKTVSSQEVEVIAIKKDIQANTVRDDGQDARMEKFVENLNIMNENISNLMKAEGLVAKPLKI